MQLMVPDQLILKMGYGKTAVILKVMMIVLMITK